MSGSQHEMKCPCIEYLLCWLQLLYDFLIKTIVLKNFLLLEDAIKLPCVEDPYDGCNQYSSSFIIPPLD